MYIYVYLSEKGKKGGKGNRLFLRGWRLVNFMLLRIFCVYLMVCVREREREREKGKKKRSRSDEDRVLMCIIQFGL